MVLTVNFTDPTHLLLPSLIFVLNNQSWTKLELIITLVRDDYPIRHQDMLSTTALREVAKSVCYVSPICVYVCHLIMFLLQHFEANGRFPPKPQLPDTARQKEMNDAALIIQKQWIRHYFLRRDEDVFRTDLDAGLDSDDEFDFDWATLGYSDGGDDTTFAGDDVSLGESMPAAEVDLEVGDIETDVDAAPEMKEPERVQSKQVPRRPPVPPSLDTSLPWKKPSASKAISNAEKYHPRLGYRGNFYKFDWLDTTTGRHCMLGGPGEQCDMWGEGTVSQFSKYGPGITNYFKFVKWLFWVFVALSIMQAVPIAFNTYGEEEITDGTSIDYIFATTAGNLGDSNRTFAIKLPGCGSGAYQERDCEVSKEDVAILYSSVSVFTAAVVLAAFLWLRVFELREVIVLDKNTVSASDFTITVSNLPKSFKPSELKHHFTKLTNYHVIDVRIAEDNEEDILLFFKRGELFRKRKHVIELYRYEKMKGKKRDKFYEELTEDIKELTLKIRKIESLLAKHLDKKVRKNKESIPLLAYVTFEESLGAHRALQIYRDTWWSYWFMDENRRFKGMRPHLERSPQPSIIIWENLGMKAKIE